MRQNFFCICALSFVLYTYPVWSHIQLFLLFLLDQGKYLEAVQDSERGKFCLLFSIKCLNLDIQSFSLIFFLFFSLFPFFEGTMTLLNFIEDNLSSSFDLSSCWGFYDYLTLNICDAVIAYNLLDT